MSYTNPIHFPCVRLLPLDLTGDITDYEYLLVLARKLNELVKNYNTLLEDHNELKLYAHKLEDEIDALETTVNKVAAGDYVNLYLSSLQNYMDKWLEEFVARVTKYIHFEISVDGYLIAKVPTNWNIQFETIVEPSSPLYGHLILKW